MIFLQLFYTFLKIGLFSFGGGYGMLSMIQAEVVTQHHWLTMQEFTDIVAVSQMTPGPIGINTATYVGYTSVIGSGMAEWMAVLGSLVSSFSVMLPSFVLMLLISRYLMKYSHHRSVEALFSGLRPAVVGLIGSAALLLMNGDNFGRLSQEPLQFIISLAIFAIAFCGILRRASPILLLIVCGFLGWLFYGLLEVT